MKQLLRLKTGSTLSWRLLAIGVLLVPAFGFNAPVHAQNLDCSGSQRVEQSFANGAKWSLCWENRSREGIIYSDIHYSPPGGAAIQILAQAGLAQIHVPYDDDGARFHDVSDYGLGDETHLNNLTSGDCPGGSLLSLGGKNMVCRKFVTEGPAWLSESQGRTSQSLRLFSVSHVGAYNYIPEWRFFDDGTIEPSIGATGRLQRRGNNSDHGWFIRNGGGSDAYGISHMHNYFWRLDFDLGEDGNNERIEELTAQLQSGNRQRRVEISQITQEQARSVEPQTMRFWRIRDNSLVNAAGTPISVDILPIETGHHGAAPTYENFVNNDIYFTRFRACERFASHNPFDSSGGCMANDDVTDFVNGEGLVNQDLVVWFGLSFHHVPRDEDEPYMHSHWNRFRIQPRDLYVSLEGPDDDPDPATPVCGQPQFDTETDKAIFFWRSCTNPAEWHTLVTAAGTGVDNHIGEIYTANRFSGITKLSLESSDTADLLDTTTLGYNLRTIAPWKDEFMFTVNGNADICVNTRRTPDSARVYVGGNRVPVTAALFNPRTLEACTPPDSGNSPRCGRPSIDRSSDRGVFVWQDCSTNNWHLFESAASSDTVSDVYVGNFQASGGINDARPISLEDSDTLTFSGNRVDFNIRTVRPWSDEIFIESGGGSICVNFTSRPAGVVTYVGRDRLQTPLSRFDPTTLAACQ